MFSRSAVFVGVFGLLSAATVQAQPAEVGLVFMQQGNDCRLVLSSKYLGVDLPLNQIGYFSWDVEYRCADSKSLRIDQDLTAPQPCSFCNLTFEAVDGSSHREPNPIPSYATGLFGYRVRLCDPNTTNNCVEHDPEVEVRRPPTFDGTVHVSFTEYNGVCSAAWPPAVRLTRAYSVVSWLVQNGCSRTVSALARPVESTEASQPCSLPILVPARENGRVACLLPSRTAGAAITVGFELVVDKTVAPTPMRVDVTLLNAP